MFGTYDNAIVQVFTPSDAKRQDSLLRPPVGNLGVYTPGITAAQTGQNPVSELTEVRLSSTILPMACHVDWDSSKRQAAPNDTYYFRSAILTAAYNENALRYILQYGSIIRLKRTLPGKNTDLFRVASVSPSPAAFSPGIGSIECDLVDYLAPVNSF